MCSRPRRGRAAAPGSVVVATAAVDMEPPDSRTRARRAPRLLLLALLLAAPPGRARAESKASREGCGPLRSPGNQTQGGFHACVPRSKRCGPRQEVYGRRGELLLLRRGVCITRQESWGHHSIDRRQPVESPQVRAPGWRPLRPGLQAPQWLELLPPRHTELKPQACPPIVLFRGEQEHSPPQTSLPREARHPAAGLGTS